MLCGGRIIRAYNLRASSSSISFTSLLKLAHQTILPFVDSRSVKPCSKQPNMHLFDGLWTSITYVTSFLSLSPFEGPSGKEQAPLLTTSDVFHFGSHRGPIFKPPGGRLIGPGSEFTCDYSQMVGWSNCSTPENRTCWLRNDKTGLEYNISTNYEDINQTPIGIHRNYVLNVTDQWINADGLNFAEGKVFNGSYPGPWIQACWGDVCILLPTLHNFNLLLTGSQLTILTILTECHYHCQQPSQEQWYQYPLAWDPTMVVDEHGWS